MATRNATEMETRCANEKLQEDVKTINGDEKWEGEMAIGTATRNDAVKC